METSQKYGPKEKRVLMGINKFKMISLKFFFINGRLINKKIRPKKLSLIKITKF